MTTSWPEVPLGEVCQFKYGKSLPAPRRSGFGSPVFGSNGQVGMHEESLTEGPTVVIGRKGSFGEVHYSAVGCWPIDTTYYVDESSTSADLRWLYYRMGSLRLTDLNRAAAIPGLNREDAYRQRLLLPPISEQRRIADILDKADEVRAKRRKTAELLEALGHSIFVGKFGDPFLNPMGFPVARLDAIALAINDCPHSTPKWQSEGLVCLRTSNLGRGQWMWDDTRYVSAPTFEERSRRGRLEAGDIVLSREGTVGIAACVEDGMTMCMGQRLVQVRPNQDLVQSRYLLPALLALLEPSRISSLMVGSTATHLNVRDLRALPIPIPPMQSQDDYSDLLGRVTDTQDAVDPARQEADDLFASLQQRAFQGAL